MLPGGRAGPNGPIRAAVPLWYRWKSAARGAFHPFGWEQGFCVGSAEWDTTLPWLQRWSIPLDALTPDLIERALREATTKRDHLLPPRPGPLHLLVVETWKRRSRRRTISSCGSGAQPHVYLWPPCIGLRPLPPLTSDVVQIW